MKKNLFWFFMLIIFIAIILLLAFVPSIKSILWLYKILTIPCYILGAVAFFWGADNMAKYLDEKNIFESTLNGHSKKFQFTCFFIIMLICFAIINNNPII